MSTRTIYWKDKFDGAAVIIDAKDFDPAIHSDTPWAVEGEPSKDEKQKGKGKKADEGAE